MRGQMLRKTLRLAKVNSATILTWLGAIGVITTAVSAGRVTPKAIELLNEAKKKKGEELTVVEKVKVATPVYTPAIVSGAVTISCIFGANIINKRQQASLMSAYAALNNYHNQYRNKLIEIHGEEADEQIRSEIARYCHDYHQIDLDTPDSKFLFYDEYSGETFEKYEREIMDAEYHLNRNFVLRGYASLNEFYMFLGLPLTDHGDKVGWSISDGYYWIDFEHRLITRDDGGPDVYSIDAVFAPDSDYMRDWE